jgi:hypothetical protein
MYFKFIKTNLIIIASAVLMFVQEHLIFIKLMLQLIIALTMLMMVEEHLIFFKLML